MEKALDPVQLKDLVFEKHAKLNGYNIWALEHKRLDYTGTDLDILIIQAPWRVTYKFESTWPMNCLWGYMLEHSEQTQLRVWIKTNPYCKAMLHIGEEIADSRTIFSSEIKKYDKKSVETSNWEVDP